MKMNHDAAQNSGVPGRGAAKSEFASSISNGRSYRERYVMYGESGIGNGWRIIDLTKVIPNDLAVGMPQLGQLHDAQRTAKRECADEDDCARCPA